MNTLNSIEEFAKAVQNAIEEYFGDEKEICIQKVNKTNGIILTGVTIRDHSSNMSPTFYLNMFFKRYQQGMSFGEIIEQIIEAYRENRIEENMDISFYSDYEKVRTRIAIKLISYEKNEELLKQIPHMRHLDLAIICQCMIMNDFFGKGSILIRREHLENWGITSQTLFEDAKKSTVSVAPAEIKNIREIMQDPYRDTERERGIEPEKTVFRHNRFNIEEQLHKGKPYDVPMYVLSNRERVNGAAAMVYPGVLKQIASFFHSDLYILPSSVHEVIILPKEEETKKINLSQMVYEINETLLSREEVLADHAYQYSLLRDEMECLPLIPE